MMKNLFVVLTILILAPCTSIAKPTNYDECILENISNAQTNAGVGAVRKACRSLFPEAKKEPVKLYGKKVVYETKKFFLTQVSSRKSGGFLIKEVTNDTEYYVSNITYLYKESLCEIPTKAAPHQRTASNEHS